MSRIPGLLFFFVLSLMVALPLHADLPANSVTMCVKAKILAGGGDPDKFFRMQNLSSPQSFAARAYKQFMDQCTGVEHTSERTDKPALPAQEAPSDAAGAAA